LVEYNWDDQIKKDEMGGARSADRKIRNAYNILIERPEGKA
jgi:hypothetical protein